MKHGIDQLDSLGVWGVPDSTFEAVQAGEGYTLDLTGDSTEMRRLDVYGVDSSGGLLAAEFRTFTPGPDRLGYEEIRLVKVVVVGREAGKTSLQIFDLGPDRERF